jgi:hypothetical protein
MIYPEIRNIHSPDLEPPNLPEDPFDCDVSFRAIVGPSGEKGEEAFTFRVITPVRLARDAEPQWGRGKLIIAAFEWPAVVQAIAQLLAHSARPTWNEVVTALDKELHWEVSSETDA